MHDSSQLLVLLAQMREEHDESSASIEQLDKQISMDKRSLADQAARISCVNAEQTQIALKSRLSAGSMRQLEEVSSMVHAWYGGGNNA